MFEALFSATVVFFVYTAYALVGEQVAISAQARPTKKPAQPKAPVTATKAGALKKKATAEKKPAGTAKVKKSQDPVIVTADAIRRYLAKNGDTTIAKLTRELPAGKTTIQHSIDNLVQEGAITQTTQGRAKAVALKS